MWLEMETAPKNRTILLDVGLPWAVVGVFNPIGDGWAFAELHVGMVDGEYDDTYFQNEIEKEPRAWMELPPTREVTILDLVMDCPDLYGEEH